MVAILDQRPEGRGGGAAVDAVAAGAVEAAAVAVGGGDEREPLGLAELQRRVAGDDLRRDRIRWLLQ